MFLLLPLILLIAGAYVAFLVGRYGSKDSNMSAIITALFSLGALIVSGLLALAWVDFNNGVTEFMGLNMLDILTYTLGGTNFFLEPLGAFLMLVATYSLILMATDTATYAMRT